MTENESPSPQTPRPTPFVTGPAIAALVFAVVLFYMFAAPVESEPTVDRDANDVVDAVVVLPDDVDLDAVMSAIETTSGAVPDVEEVAGESVVTVVAGNSCVTAIHRPGGIAVGASLSDGMCVADFDVRSPALDGARADAVRDALDTELVSVVASERSLRAALIAIEPAADAQWAVADTEFGTTAALPVGPSTCVLVYAFEDEAVHFTARTALCRPDTAASALEPNARIVTSSSPSTNTTS